jgi:hypothetical protein
LAEALAAIGALPESEGDGDAARPGSVAGPDRNRSSAAINGLIAEFPDLVARLRRLAELEERFDAAVEQAKLDALKELAYGASHELNNPLANISARAQTLLQEEKDPERRRRLAAINSQAFRAHEMIADMMLFARPPQLQPHTVNLVELLEDLIRRLADEAAQQDTELVFVGPNSPVEARVDPVHLRAAVRALVINALEALADGGRIEVGVRAVPGSSRTSAAMAEIVVADNGPGISAEIRAHMFDPFYSGREAGRGLGLGLSKCWRIVTQHGGRIEVESNPAAEIGGRGARFKIMLPISA